jgi:hypothetical protein
MRHEIIQRFLAEETAVGPHQGTIPDAIAHALRALMAQLQPLVGAPGARALYARSLHLTRASCGWPPEMAQGPLGELPALLHGDLSVRTAHDARQAGESLLLTFVDLLISLIGEPLTYRLLHSAWGHPGADELLQEKAQ